MTGTHKSGRKPKASTIVERNRKKGVEISDSKGIPHAPEHLSEEERIEWRRVARLLREAGLIEQLDKTLLSAYCVAYSRWVKAEAEIKEYGLLIKSSNGYPMPSPYLPIVNKALEQMLKILGELGMTPTSRSHITKQGQEKGKRKIKRMVQNPDYDPRDYLRVTN